MRKLAKGVLLFAAAFWLTACAVVINSSDTTIEGASGSIEMAKPKLFRK